MTGTEQQRISLRKLRVFEPPAGAGCPVLVFDGMAYSERCSRPIHQAPSGTDEEAVCLMHSRDKGKDQHEFQREIDHILAAAGNGIADFSGFVFPAVAEFRPLYDTECVFRDAVFTEAAYFPIGGFSAVCDFAGASFEGDAWFHDFKMFANFSGVTFGGDRVHFGSFDADANFYGATCKPKTLAMFLRSTFNGQCDFRSATFEGDVSFEEAVFEKAADFSKATFAQYVNFSSAKFSGLADFRETVFRRDDELKPGPEFRATRFAIPQEITFYRTYLGQALFYNCDVSNLAFSNVEWRRRSRNGKRMVFEEVVDLTSASALSLQEKTSLDTPQEATHIGKRNYDLIAELYQQLKKNFDERSDYSIAGDFHYGELEMKRLSSSTRSSMLRWMHQHLGLIAWYKRASQYGESYIRPGLWFIAVLLMFSMLYPATGLKWSHPGRSLIDQIAHSTQMSPNAEASYSRPFLKGCTSSEEIWLARFQLVGCSFITTMYIAAFQQNLEFEPTYPWGQVLRLIEVSLSATLLALFLLAIARQFKR